jgi:H/ACA ribonucleoprotein complex subunit 3
VKWLIRKCRSCGRYVIVREKCPFCGGELYVPHPPRFSPEDKYVKYRLKMKIVAGLLNLDLRGGVEKPSE